MRSLVMLEPQGADKEQQLVALGAMLEETRGVLSQIGVLCASLLPTLEAAARLVEQLYVEEGEGQ